MTEKRTIVVALGGNALQRQGEASSEAQQKVADETVRQLLPLIQAGHNLTIVHGNGPQVGNIVLQQQAINTHEQVGKEVRQAIQRIGGDLPENIPPAEPIRQVERRVRDAVPRLELDERDASGLLGDGAGAGAAVDGD